MKDGMLTITLKTALFIIIFSIIMLFVTAFGSAEWYICVATAFLMLVLIVTINVIFYVRNRRNKK